MLLVQEFLKNKTLKDLENEHGVFASFSKCKTFFSLNYGMIEARDDDKLSQQCRGLILSKMNGVPIEDDIIGETNILSFGFERFFNEGQGAAAPIDWNDKQLKIYSKEDGTAIFVWFNPYTNKWNVATRGTPEANVPLDFDKNMTFRSLFESVLETRYAITFEQLTSDMYPNITYIFELCTPFNKIVVNYPQSTIFFIGARNLISLEEYYVENDIFHDHLRMFPIPNVYSFANITDTVNFVVNGDATQLEGVVVVSSNFNRVKVKNPMHGIYSRARDSLGTSDRNCLECILAGKDDDIITVMPQEIANKLLSIKEKYRVWLSMQEQLFYTVFREASNENPGDKKTFAITLNKYVGAFKPAFFSIFDKKSHSVKDFIEKNRKEGSWPSSFLDKILSAI
jgi:hypothetical protein